MNIRQIFLAAAAVLVLATACGKRYETVAGDPLQTKIYTLDNGLKVYMSVNREQPRIQTYMAVRVGSKNDPSETTGLSHYLEHVMFKGTEQFGTSDYASEKPLLDEIERLFELYRRTTGEAERLAIYHQIDSVSYEASKYAIPNEYDKLMAVIGAVGTNAWTSDDETVYTEDIPSNQIDNWARIQADRFRNCVIRGFHTELETVYEEKNMTLTRDSEKAYEALARALYPHHPYGQQTTIGTQEHLKNPSITNIKAHLANYYVPNNIAVCVSGDFDPDEMVAAIEKYFGDWKPNPSVPVLQYEAEAPITSPIEKEVYGLEAENLSVAWRLPGARDLRTAAVAEMAGSILSNGQAGLMDLDINQQQKALYVMGGYQSQPDYGSFLLMGAPKQGQSLEELRDLLLAEVAKLRAGDFDESLLEATLNNIKLSKMRQLENNSARARQFVNAFIDGIDWKDACKELDRLAAVTKEDVVAFANEYLAGNAYAVVYKRQGEDRTVQKITAPKITPIVTNRDKTSAFLSEIQNSPVKPVEPVFVDFSKDMSRFTLAPGAEVLYKHNEINDIFTLNAVYNCGTQQDPALAVAFEYLSYLGTPGMTPEQIASRMYALGCSYSAGAGAFQSSFSVRGLSENLPAALRIVEDLARNAVPDEAILANLKADLLKSRADAKRSQGSCGAALTAYVQYGPEYVRASALSDAQLKALTSGELLSKVRAVFDQGHELLYYGPATEQELKAVLAENHYVAEGAVLLPERHAVLQTTPSDRVLLVQYDAKQLQYTQYSDRGEAYDPANAADLALFNEYFGSGMNAIVFQEMREARGLAYTARARLSAPSYADDSYSFTAYIATQNDKLRQAGEAFTQIINEMPQSEAAFSVARDALLSRLRTQRTTGMNVLRSYQACRRLGLSEPTDRAVFEKVQQMTLADVVATQRKWVKDRTYTHAILGDIKDMDAKYLSTLGPVREVSLEEIFGY
ncbi:MAG: insulinase family protein [Bacteroidales bacterium]|nr:insulinase family protein [Bacteroidales bacterium]